MGTREYAEGYQTLGRITRDQHPGLTPKDGAAGRESADREPPIRAAAGARGGVFQASDLRHAGRIAETRDAQ